ncbi:MAG: DinB family protein, partial [Myxococcota bacterium]
MNPTDHYRALARYNTWMNQRIYGLCADRLDDAARKRDEGAFFGSIHGTLNHLLLADRAWMRRFTGDRDKFASRDGEGRVIEIRALDQELYADFAELRRQRESRGRPGFSPVDPEILEIAEAP